ncbi:hypothetical protein AB0N14_28010 [Streptomyces sp. NPDC051104]|uniref:hypothetical protein n=1 Tax=Streptomyces sp. NPDC051104 TaxID=3155044 RepID=UPI00342E5D93
MVALNFSASLMEAPDAVLEEVFVVQPLFQVLPHQGMHEPLVVQDHAVPRADSDVVPRQGAQRLLVRFPIHAVDAAPQEHTESYLLLGREQVLLGSATKAVLMQEHPGRGHGSAKAGVRGRG